MTDNSDLGGRDSYVMGLNLSRLVPLGRSSPGSTSGTAPPSSAPPGWRRSLSAAEADVRALQVEVETLCRVLDVIASHMPDNLYRCEVERAAASARAHVLALADWAARARFEEMIS